MRSAMVAAGILAAVGAVWGIIWGIRALNRYNRRTGRDVALPLKGDERYRVNAIGHADHVGEMRELLKGQGRDGFEPEIVRPWFGIRRTGRFTMVAVLAGIGVGTSAALLTTAVIPFRTLSGFGYWYWCIGALGGLAIADFAWPAYLRISPGRLDVFRYPFLGGGTPHVESYDLRAWRVTVLLGAGVVSLSPPIDPEEVKPLPERSKRWPYGVVEKPDERAVAFSMFFVAGRRAMAMRVIRGAVSDAPTPPLPDDALTG
jgi:hypothetical protein